MPSGLAQDGTRWILPLHVTLLLLLAAGAQPLGGIDRAMCQWDCGWYEQIARNGYDMPPRWTSDDYGQASWAFFPLYPLLLRAMIDLTGLGAHAAGLAIGAILFPVLVLLAATYMRDRVGDDGANGPFRTVMFLILPTGFWFRLPYTECLYGVLLLGMLMVLARGRTLAAMLLAALLCLTRPTGLVCVIVAALFHAFAPGMRAPGAGRPTRLVEGGVVILAGGTGLASFIFFLDHLLGDGLAFAHVQAAWGHQPHLPSFWIGYGFTHRRTLHLAIAALLEIGLIGWGLRIGWRMESCTLLATFLLAGSAGIMSIHRIVLGNPLAGMLLTIMADRAPPSWRRWLILLCLVLDCVFADSWLHGRRFLA
ncbi:hypothetical protein ACLRDC_07195 [Gluconacetobacter sacchari]|nr:hypothetical protein [Gluconacetobacter sacchari]